MIWDHALRLRHIKCFLEVARVESVTLAAASLNITQPAVSKTIKELEAILETQLFDRVGRQLHLNEQGRIFQNHAAASWLELSKAKDRLTKEQRRRELRIGSLPTAATELVPDAVLAFSQDNPNSQLKVRTGPNWMLFNQLRDGQLDLVVGRMPDADLLTDITFEQFYSEDVVCVVRPDHPILLADQPSGHFLNYPLVMPPKGAVIRPTVERYLTSIGLKGAQGAVETVSLPIGRRIVQRSDYIWFISRGVVIDELLNGSLISCPLQSDLLAGPVGVFTLANATPDIERSAFVQILRNLSVRLRR